MKIRKSVIFAIVFVVGLVCVGGVYYYLNSQIPRGEPGLERPPLTDPEGPTTMDPAAP